MPNILYSIAFLLLDGAKKPANKVAENLLRKYTYQCKKG